MVHVFEACFALLIQHVRPANNTGHRFADQVITHKVGGEFVAPVNRLAATRREVVEGAVGPEAFGTALRVGVGNDRPDGRERLLVISIGKFERTVFWVDLKPGPGVFTPRPAEEKSSVVVVRKTPLPVGTAGQ